MAILLALLRTQVHQVVRHLLQGWRHRQRRRQMPHRMVPRHPLADQAMITEEEAVVVRPVPTRLGRQRERRQQLQLHLHTPRLTVFRLEVRQAVCLQQATASRRPMDRAGEDLLLLLRPLHTARALHHLRMAAPSPLLVARLRLTGLRHHMAMAPLHQALPVVPLLQVGQARLRREHQEHLLRTVVHRAQTASLVIHKACHRHTATLGSQAMEPHRQDSLATVPQVRQVVSPATALQVRLELLERLVPRHHSASQAMATHHLDTQVRHQQATQATVCHLLEVHHIHMAILLQALQEVQEARCQLPRWLGGTGAGRETDPAVEGTTGAATTEMVGVAMIVVATAVVVAAAVAKVMARSTLVRSRP